jgi:hypothetical protein
MGLVTDECVRLGDDDASAVVVGTEDDDIEGAVGVGGAGCVYDTAATVAVVGDGVAGGSFDGAGATAAAAAEAYRNGIGAVARGAGAGAGARPFFNMLAIGTWEKLGFGGGFAEHDRQHTGTPLKGSSRTFGSCRLSC